MDGSLCCPRVAEALMLQEEELLGSTSEEESGSEDQQSGSSVIDVEDLGQVMDRVKKEKVTVIWEAVSWGRRLVTVSCLYWCVVPLRSSLDSVLSLPPVLRSHLRPVGSLDMSLVKIYFSPGEMSSA